MIAGGLRVVGMVITLGGGLFQGDAENRRMLESQLEQFDRCPAPPSVGQSWQKVDGPFDEFSFAALRHAGRRTQKSSSLFTEARAGSAER